MPKFGPGEAPDFIEYIYSWFGDFPQEKKNLFDLIYQYLTYHRNTGISSDEVWRWMVKGAFK